MNIIMEPNLGGDFQTTAKKAKEWAAKSENTVEFDFNGIKCLVNSNTYLDGLLRDFMNAHLMEWKTVGPECPFQYEIDLDIEIHTKKLNNLKELKIEQDSYKAKMAIKKEAFAHKVKNISMEFSDKATWDMGLSKNTDSYGACIYEYAEGWAKLMQLEIANGKSVAECAEAASFEMDFLGITGFMYGAAVSILSKCWAHGEELRKWHNKEYNHDGEGVINPAIITIG